MAATRPVLLRASNISIRRLRESLQHTDIDRPRIGDARAELRLIVVAPTELVPLAWNIVVLQPVLPAAEELRHKLAAIDPAEIQKLWRKPRALKVANDFEFGGRQLRANDGSSEAKRLQQPVGKLEAYAPSCASLNAEENLLRLAHGLVHHDEAAAIVAAQLLIRVQKLDAVNGSIGPDIHVERFAQMDRLDLRHLLLKTEVGDIVTGIVGQLHEIKST